VDNLAADFSILDHLMNDVCARCSLGYTTNSIPLEGALQNLEQFQLTTFPDYVGPLFFKLTLKSLNSCLQLLPLVESLRLLGTHRSLFVLFVRFALFL